MLTGTLWIECGGFQTALGDVEGDERENALAGGQVRAGKVAAEQTGVRNARIAAEAGPIFEQRSSYPGLRRSWNRPVQMADMCEVAVTSVSRAAALPIAYREYG